MNTLRAFLGLVVGLALASAAVNPVVANDFASPPGPPAVELNGDAFKIGDIVAQGVRNANGGCDFGVIKVKTTSPNDGNTRWVGILLDTQCRVVVNAKWEGVLDDGPADVVGQLRKLLAAQSSPVFEETQPYLGTAEEASVVPLGSGVKVSEQHIWMYGYGGSGDQLTHKRGKLEFSWNGTTATVMSETGSCQGSAHDSWNWVVDQCVRTGYDPGPASIVFREGRGDYHCSPTGSLPCNLSNPDGYYHSLYDNEDGHFDGTSHCTFSWSGNIVVVDGVSREIVSSCY